MVFVQASVVQQILRREEDRSGVCDMPVQQLNNDSELLALLEKVRLSAAKAMGLGDCSNQASPKLCVVAPPLLDAEPVDLRCRYFVAPWRNETHPTLAMTAGQCLGAAAFLEGSVVRAAMGTNTHLMTPASTNSRKLRVAHAAGSLDVIVELSSIHEHNATLLLPDGSNLERTGYVRTAFPLASGHAFL